MSNEGHREIVLKAWDTYQGIIAGLGDGCWKIRSVFYTASFGLIAAAFSSDLRVLYLLNVPLAVFFCILEAGYQRIQEQYIGKTIRIERTINDLLAGEQNPWMPNDGISTSLNKPTLKDLRRVFRPAKYLFWLSYLTIVLLSLVLFAFKATKSRVTGAEAPPCAPLCCIRAPCPDTTN